MTARRHLVLRADATVDMGSGHVMRGIALAQAWIHAGGAATFVTHCPVPALLSRMKAIGADVRPLEAPWPAEEDPTLLASALHDTHAQAVTVDGYQFDTEYQRRAHDLGVPLLVFDDYGHAGHYCADIILNQNLGAEHIAYTAEPYTRLLLGPRYALLRDEFRPYRGWQREVPETARRVLVTLGGSDPDNATLSILRALPMVAPDLEIRVVIGGANPHLAILSEVARATGATLCRDVQDMAELMAWADFCISAGGTTCWELAFMGLPNAIVVLAENQAGAARELDRQGVSVCLGEPNDLSDKALQTQITPILHDATRRRAMSQRGREWVDGLGTDRVIAALTRSPRA